MTAATKGVIELALAEKLLPIILLETDEIRLPAVAVAFKPGPVTATLITVNPAIV